jgi:putative transposase
MANTYTSLHCHVIFSTKRRERWIAPAIEERVWSYLGGIARENKLKAVLVGGVDDHVHLLLASHPSISVSEAVKRIKGGSSRWMKEQIQGLQNCRKIFSGRIPELFTET